MKTTGPWPVLDSLVALPVPARVVLAIGAALAVAFGDLVTGADVAFTLLYLGPIAFAAWSLGRRVGVLLAVASSLTWLTIEITSHQVTWQVGLLVLDFLIQLATFVSIALLVARLRRHLEHENELASTDSLTGVANRRTFQAAAELEIDRSRRSGSPFSVAYLDVDAFKSINDRFGHRMGDEVLRTLASALRSSVRRVDVVGRLGGDEFALLLPDTGSQGALSVMGKVREVLAHSEVVPGEVVTCSMGCVSWLTPPENADAMLERVDRVMYEVKRAGGNRSNHEIWNERTPA